MSGPLAIDRTFDSVSLPELEQAASLLTRVDRKYVLTGSRASTVIGLLDPRTALLQIDSSTSFAYRSSYFDTADLLLYRETLTGRRRRAKVRIRTYPDGQSMIEIKRRDSRDNTDKIRMPVTETALSVESVGTLAADAQDFVDATLERPGLASQLLRTVETNYSRSTMLDVSRKARCTIDSALTLSDVASGVSRSFPNVVIIETKTLGRACDMDRVLWQQGIRPCSISKFGAAVALLHGNVPHNRWRRVLTRYFLNAT